MNANNPSPDPRLEALLGGLTPRCDLDNAAVLYAAGRAAAEPELAAGHALRVRRWQAASVASSLVAASLAVAVAWPRSGEPLPTAPPSLVQTPGVDAAPTAPIDRDNLAENAADDAAFVVGPWSSPLRITNVRVLRAGMSPLEMRQVLVRDDQLAGGSGTDRSDANEPVTPRSLKRFFEQDEFRRNSST